mgnify:CR=1 FL=1
MIKWILTFLFASLTVALMLFKLPFEFALPGMRDRIMVPEQLLNNQDYLVYGCVIAASYCLIFLKGFKGVKNPVCVINGFKWDLNDFCRGWLITGKTGSGKTASAIQHILHQLFRRVTTENNHKPFGGVAVDQKGNFFQIIEDIAKNYDQSDRLITLQVRPDGAAEDWKAKYKFNLLSYPGIPSSTYSKIIMDTAASLGQESGGGSSFFTTQAKLHIEKGIDLLKIFTWIKEHPDSIKLESLLGRSKPLLDPEDPESEEDPSQKSDYEFYKTMPNFVSLRNLLRILTDKDMLGMQIGLLQMSLENEIFNDEKDQIKVNKMKELILHFKAKFLDSPEDQLGGVIGTIYNTLGFFDSDEIEEVFCSETNTVEFEQVDEGIIFSVSMPQKFQSERIYVNTIMKLIYYTHALGRFDRPDDLKSNNLLVFIADEAQGVITASKDGMTDYTVIDKIREARATVLFATQSTTSFLPVMKKDQVDTLLLNLANQCHYTVPDKNSAEQTADIIGKKEMTKKSHGNSGGKSSVNFQKVDEHIIKPHILRAMKKFECVLIHCESGHKKFTLKPIAPNGKVPAYYSQIKR